MCKLGRLVTLPLLFFACEPSVAQLAASAAAATSVGASSAVPTKSDKPAEAPARTPPTGAKRQHFLDVVSLASHDITFVFDSTSCFHGQLRFPAANAFAIAKLLSSETGFALAATSPSQIAIFYTTDTRPAKQAIEDLKNNIEKLGKSDVSEAVAIRVPADSAARVLSQVTLPSDTNIMVKAVGSSCILVISKIQADALTVAAVKKSIAGAYEEIPSTPPAQRLFYLDAATVAKKLSGSSTDSASSEEGSIKSKPSAKDSGAGPASPSASVSVAVGGSVAPNSKTDQNGSSKTPHSSSSADTSADGSAPASSDDAIANNKEPLSSEKAKAKSTTSSMAKPPAMQALNDMLIFSNDDGTDRGFLERNRLMAILDLPRPEVLMNIWSLQASSKKPEVISEEAEAARELIAHNNDILLRSIEGLWDSLSRQMADPQYFDQLFYKYVTQRFGETGGLLAESNGTIVGPSEAGSSKNERSAPSKSSTTEKRVQQGRDKWGWCEPDQYCLGYHAFEPLRPSLASILMGIAAAKYPLSAAQKALSESEQQLLVIETQPLCSDGTVPRCRGEKPVTQFRRCMEDSQLMLRTFHEKSAHDCEVDDRIALDEQILRGKRSQIQALPLKCFGEQAEVVFKDKRSGDKLYATSRVGLLRAAIADFLFNYKWAAQYPHEFVPYDLAQSAQELNAEFNPLVLAFNRDVAAFSVNLQEQMQCEYHSDIKPKEARSWFGQSDNTFINDGILSVRGIGGVESLAETVTQSFFDATNPPSLTDLVKSVSDAEKNVPGVLKANLSANEAAVLLGALNSVQPAEAKIGRQLKLDITPHSLPTASSAELEVKLTAQETGNPTRFTADKSTEDTLSRVAKHDVTTRVRVESLKLFEVSAFSAMQQRPRSKFPIVPPLFEVPYFGSFIGFPLKGAQIYHRSTAIVSAVIVPTATDLAYGIDFSADRFCDSDGGCRLAKSPKEFGQPLRNFHKAVVGCLASGGTYDFNGGSPYSGRLLSDAAKAGNPCSTLSFGSVPPYE